MLNKRTFVLLLLTILFSWVASPLHAQQQGEVVDQIVAMVNDNIILKSEVDQRVAQYMQQSRQNEQQLDFTKALWYDALESLIDEYVLLEKGKLDSVQVSDEQVGRAMDQRINQLINRAGSEEKLEEALGKSLVQIKADYREQFREDMIVQQVRQKKMNEISVSRPEVVDYYNRIPQDSIPTVPERVGLAQVVAIPKPEANAKEEARQLAKQLRDSVLNHDKDIADLAERWSDGPSASRGGLLPMMPLADLVPEYSAAASALKPGDISEVVETSYGFHVIKLIKRVGDKIETRHILISMDENKLDEEGAKEKLRAIRDSVLHHDKSFSEMARKHSDDKSTASLGGKLFNPQTGERMISLSSLDPALYRIALLLEEEGDISEPKQFKPDQRSAKKAYRIVQLQRRIPEHKANLEQDFELIERYAKQAKQMRVMQTWLDELREQIYVEYKIDVPDNINKVSDRI